MSAAIPSPSKPSFLAIPQNRLRARTITTPVATPSDGPSVFLTDDQLQHLLQSPANHWEGLPIEVKSHILSFLSTNDKIRYRAVDREWFRLLTDGSLWQQLDASSFYAKIPAPQLLRLIQCASPFVQDLNLRGCSQLNANHVLPMTSLMRASFEGCRFFTSSSLSALLSRNHRLQSIDLSGLHATTDNVLDSIATHCKIVSINLNYCRNISTAGLHAFLLASVKLKDLRLSECVLNQDIMLAIHSLKDLDRLSLAGCNSLQDIFVKYMIYGQSQYGVIFPETRVKSNIRHLDVSRCAQLTSNCLRYMQGTLPCLQKLELAGLVSITDETLSQTFPTLPNLTHIDLEDCAVTDHTLQALAICPSVRHIQLSHCDGITDTGVLALVENLALNHLDLDNTNVTNVVMGAIAARNQPIRVSIYDCPYITWTGVLSILTANSAHPVGAKRLKTFYGWQRPVDGHTKRVLKGDLIGAREIERDWALYMMQSQEAVMRTGAGRSRFLDFDEEGVRIIGRERRRARCLIM